MKTRCAPLQRAMVIEGRPPANYGRVIRCVRLIECPIVTEIAGGPAWVYEGELTTMHGGRAYAVADAALLPLPDGMLDQAAAERLAGTPE
jgi:hypothetical protein